jgi:hypothetical protein
MKAALRSSAGEKREMGMGGASEAGQIAIN